MDWTYLQRAEKLKIEPNFWMSPLLFECSNYCEILRENGDIEIVDEVGFQILPTLSLSGICKEKREVWAGIGEPHSELKKVFLDYQYIYNPAAFSNTTGKKWKVWRKNINKFFEYISKNKQLENWFPFHDQVSYDYLTNNEYFNQMTQLLLKWLKPKTGQTIHGDEVMWEYLNKVPLHCIKGLFINQELVGLNIWDDNWKYINFRYSFADRDIPGVNYYLRYKFYTDSIISEQNKLVNDGGVLDNHNLEFFKDHLNPLQKIKIYSWEKKDEN